MATIHIRRLTTIHTRHLKYNIKKGKQHQGKKVLHTVSRIFSHTYCTRAFPQPFTSYHFTTDINFAHKFSLSPFPTLHFPSLHFTSLHFTSLHFTSLHFSTLLDDFLQLTTIITFLTLLLKIIGLQWGIPNTSAGSWFQCWMVLFRKEYFSISVFCLLLLISRS